MKKKDINIILSTVALFVLFKTLFKGNHEGEGASEEEQIGEEASDFEYDLLNSKELLNQFEDDEPEEKDLVEWLQATIDGFKESITSRKVEEDEEEVEAESVSDDDF